MPEEKLASRWLVSTDWLSQHLNDPNVIVLDGSFYLPALKRDAEAEFLAGHIPGAARFDIDAIIDKSNPLPHMLPSAEQFAAQVGALGIGDGMTIVVYDGAGLGGCRAVWWTFRAFGAEQVFILDGGLPKWKAEGRPTRPVRRRARRKTFTPKFNRAMVASVDDVQKVLLDKTAQVVDARAGGSFPRRGAGAAPGPARRPHAGLVQRAVHDGRAERPARVARRDAARRVRRRQSRSRPAGGDELRLGRDRRDPVASRSMRSASRRRPRLRRLLVRMGRAAGYAGGEGMTGEPSQRAPASTDCSSLRSGATRPGNWRKPSSFIAASSKPIRARSIACISSG